MMPAKLFLLRPTLGQGGADRVTLTLLQHFDRARFQPALVLSKVSGEYVNDLPPDVPVYSLGGKRLWTAWLPLTSLLRQHKPDILFSTSGGTNVIAVIAHRLSGSNSRLILSERNVLMHGEKTNKRRLLTWVKGLLYGRADQITAVSQGVKDDLVNQLGIASEKVTVVYNPIVTDKMLTLAQEPLDHPWFLEDIPVVLGVGRLVQEKGFDILIRAIAQVREKRPVRLVILGEGELRVELQTLIDSLELPGHIQLVGFDKNPFKYMARCTLFVLSSRYEGLPGALIQSMACGAAVIATDCPAGPSEIITPEVDGILVPVEDVSAMADQITRLLDSPDLRKTFSTNAQKSAVRFRADAVLENYIVALQ
ncbi:MAG: glycosyltransferase [Candidatus Promineifilaceae bacterium]